MVDTKRKSRLGLLLGMASILGVIVGVHFGLKAPLFVLKEIRWEVVGSERNRVSWIQKDHIIEASGLRVGQHLLSEVDVGRVRQAIMSLEWIRDVRVIKEYPGRVRILTEFRKPAAVRQDPSGRLYYLDTQGESFSEVNLGQISDLPVLSGLNPSQPALMNELLAVVATLEGELSRSKMRLSSIHWDSVDGATAWVMYPIHGGRAQVRSAVKLGQNFGYFIQLRTKRLIRVLNYLSEHSLLSKSVILGNAKKVVVKTQSPS